MEALIDAIMAVVTDLLLTVHLRMALVVILPAAATAAAPLPKVLMNEMLPGDSVRGYLLAWPVIPV